MKKTRRSALYVIAALFAALFVAACLAGFAACGGDSGSEDACADGHTLVKTEAKDATCTEAGNNAYWTCSVCNKVFSDEAGTTETSVAGQTIAALDHDWQLDEDSSENDPATCTTDGTQALKCSRCGATTTDTIPATGHTLVKTEAKDATCTEAGNNAYWTCSECNKVFSDESGTTETTVDNQTIAALGHTLVGTYTPGTSDEAGTWAYACSACEEPIDLTTNTDKIASLTLEAADYDSLKAAGAWNEAALDDVVPLIDVTTEINMTGDVYVKDCAKNMILNGNISVTANMTLIVTTDMTLDLNGYSITSTDNSTYWLVQVGGTSACGNLTVKDSSDQGNGKISGGTYLVDVYSPSGSENETSVLTLESGSITSTTTTNGYGVQVNNSTLNVSGGTISGYYGVAVFGQTSSSKNATVNMTGGTIEGTAFGISTNGSSQYGAEVINVSGGTVTGELVGIFFTNGSLTVSGGTISGATGIEIKSGSATISGGTISTIVTDGKTSVKENSNGESTSGYSIAVVYNSSYKDITSVTINGNVTLSGSIYVDSSIEDTVVSIDDSLKGQVATDTEPEDEQP